MIEKFKIFEKHYDTYDCDDEYWDDDDLSPLLKIAKRKNKSYDQIITLDCSFKKLTSLEGIENLVNLKHIICSNNQITSLREIENLVDLEYLSCSFNRLNNLEGIERLFNLKQLYCSFNQLTSLNGVENLINLEVLDCSHDRLINIDLEGIEDLYNIGIEEVGLFDNFKKLKYLDIRGNNLSKKYKDYLRKKFKNIYHCV